AVVQPDTFGITDEEVARITTHRPVPLIGIDHVVKVPELILVIGASRGAGRQERVGMAGDDREVVADELHDVPIDQPLLDQRMDERGEVRARRALEVRELYERNGSA